MTQEEKELLLKDLCARLPYGVKVEYKNEIFDVEHVSPMYEEVKLDTYETWTVGVSDIKPYLFPLSRLNSLTDEQKKTLKVLCDWNDEEADAQSILVLYQKHFVMKSDVIDWLHKNHFDYRGLIPMGLAEDATDKNIY